MQPSLLSPLLSSTSLPRSNLFKSAAQRMDQGRSRSEKYWVDALKIRRGNWNLIPAPLPFGSATGKGADKTSKDFLVTFGLEESPPIFRQRAIGRIPAIDRHDGLLDFPVRQNTRLQISISWNDANGSRHLAKNDLVAVDESTLETSLRAAQAEVVEQEIFSMLIKEASNLPTASARVSERLIVIDAAEGAEIRFELVDNIFTRSSGSTSASEENAAVTCNLVYAVLHILLLRAHSHVKTQRLGRIGIARPPPTPLDLRMPPILHPIVDMLQYQVFCDRVHSVASTFSRSLQITGVPTRLYFSAVGQSGEEIVALLQELQYIRIGGECRMRIDDRHTIRFTFFSPSVLISHLPQATLHVSSIPQLKQLLEDEIGSCLLGRICDLGTSLCEHVHGTWFVDLLTNRAVGRWEGRVLNFRISFEEDGSLQCSASRLERGERLPTAHMEAYTAASMPGVSLLQWVQQTIELTLKP